jgi:Tol biopolymer transport system component
MRVKKFWRIHLLAVLTLILVMLLAACGSVSPTPNTTPNVVIVTPTPNSANTPNSLVTTITAATSSTALPTVTGATKPTNAVATTAPAGSATTAATTQTPNASANSSKIVFDNANHEIMLVNPDGTGQRKLTDGTSPLLSPDGKKVAFVTGQTKDYMPPFRATIQTINLDGSNKTELCTTDKPNYLMQLVRWSPRDRFIAFGAIPAQSDGWGLISLCNTGDKKQVTPVKPRQGDASVVYDWSPDGDYVIWQSFSNNVFNLYYGDPEKAGADATLLVKGEVQPPGIPTPDFSSARFSPDGKTVAVAMNDKILLVSVPGQKSQFEGKTFTLEHPYRLAWSPDGRTLAVISVGSTTGTGTLLTLEVATGKQTKIADNVGVGVDWSRQ